MVYLVDWTDRGEDFKFDDGEVTTTKWVPLSDNEFRKKNAKAPVAEDDATYLLIRRWLENYEDL